MPKLIDQRTKEERELVKSITLIGRAEYCDVCVPERIVSREHARIRRRLTGFYIEDLGSTHGTRVNNVRVRRSAKLHDGDVITIAMVRRSGRRTVSPHPPHTDTTMPTRDTPAAGPWTQADDDVRSGAAFIFRK